jgi:MarR family transcriptional regulator, 2-MHQ and catechol-resistance regulon repressor
MGQFRVLEALLMHGPLRQDSMSELIVMDPGNLRYFTAGLEKAVLIVKRPDEEDKRQVMIHLTPQGRALITKVFPRHAKLVRAEMATLGAREQEVLSRICQKLREGNPLKFISEITPADDRDSH